MILGNVSKGIWCHFCSNTFLCVDNECIICFNKSFASHSKAKNWSNKNIKKPREVFKVSAHQYIFDCDVCNHEFIAILSDISHNNSWCSFCSNKKLCEDKKCQSCYEKSFSSHSKSKYWSPKNIEKPRNIFKNTAKKFYFNCENCKLEYYSILYSITSGRGCPYCKNKTEKKLFEWLKNKFAENNIKFQKSFDWCIYSVTKRHAKFDYLITNLNILIELDGDQHIRQVSNWTDYKKVKEKDVFKIEKAINNKYTIIHILQEDVFNNKNDWESKLKTVINNKYNEPTCIFIDNNNKYNEHIIDIKNKKNKIEII